MGYSYKTYAETKDVMKKYVNATEGSIIYSMSKTHLMTLVNKAGALYKVGIRGLSSKVCKFFFTPLSAA